MSDLEWVDLGNGRHVMRGATPNVPFARSRTKAPKGAHVSQSLPRWCPEHAAAGGSFVKSGPDKGKCIFENTARIRATEAASNGKYRYDG